MSMRCAICVVTGNPPEGPLMPHLVIYRGYSLCDEHLQLWEYQFEADWHKIVDVAREEEFDGTAGINSAEDLEAEIIADNEERESVKAAEADGTAPWLKDAVDTMVTTPETKFNVEEKLVEAKNKRRRRKKTYFCTKCDKKHGRKSNIGKKHEEFSQ